MYSATAHAQEHLYDYILFTNSQMTGNYFFSKTSSQSPSFIKNENERLPVTNTFFHSPGNALKLEYINGKKGNWKATIFKESLRSQDHFKPAQYFSFSIYNPSLHFNLKSLPVFQLMLNDSTLSDKYNFELTRSNSWETIYIPVSSFKGINFNERSDIIGIVFSQQNF